MQYKDGSGERAKLFYDKCLYSLITALTHPKPLMVLFPSIMTSTFGLLPDVTTRALTAMESGHTGYSHLSIIRNCFVWEWTFYSGPYQMIVSCYRSQGGEINF